MLTFSNFHNIQIFTVDSGISRSISDLNSVTLDVDSNNSSPGLPRVSIQLIAAVNRLFNFYINSSEWYWRMSRLIPSEKSFINLQMLIPKHERKEEPKSLKHIEQYPLWI